MCVCMPSALVSTLACMYVHSHVCMSVCTYVCLYAKECSHTKLAQATLPRILPGRGAWSEKKSGCFEEVVVVVVVVAVVVVVCVLGRLP